MNEPWLRLAHKSAYLQAAQEFSGVQFDQEKAKALLLEISVRMREIEDKVLPQFPQRPLKKSEESAYTLPAKPFCMDGSLSSHMQRFLERHDVSVTDSVPPALRWIDGNQYPITGRTVLPATKPMDLSNQDDLKNWLIAEGWEPTLWNVKKDANGKPVRDPKTKGTVRTTPKMQENGRLCPNLEEMSGDLVKPVVTWLSYRNRKSVIEGWLENPRLAFDGRLSAASSGVTNTFRQKHTIVCNVPKNKPHVLLGKEMRELFVAYPGQVLVGWDASALEDRIKGHLTHRFDGGAYAAKILGEGYDPHQENADLWSIDRSIAKNGTYALGYFCGVKKLASTIKCSESEAKTRHDAYWELNKALKDLDEAIARHWEFNGKAWIKGLDGRKVRSRARHSLVNLAIQSSGSILMDYAGAWMDKALGGIKLLNGTPSYLYKGHRATRVIFMHDEYVWSVDPEIADDIVALGEQSIEQAGKYFKMKVPLVSTGAKGMSWADLK